MPYGAALKSGVARATCGGKERSRPSERRVACRALALTVAAAAVVLAASRAAAQQDLTGVVRVFTTETRDAGGEADAYGGTVDLRMGRSITNVLSYLFTVRYASIAQQPLFGVEPLSDTRSQQVEPRLEFRLGTPSYELSLGDRWLQSTDRNAETGEVERTENNFFARFATRSERAPTVQLQYDRRDGTRGDADTFNNLLFGQVALARERWAVSAGRRRTTEETGTSGLRRSGEENLLSASFNRGFAGDTVTVFGGYTRNDLDILETLPRETRVPIPRAFARGLSALDPTPADGALATDAALVDGNRTAPTDANIGGGLSGGRAGWNLGVEFSLQLFVDVVDVWLASPIPADNAARYQWAVYSSPDNLFWTAVPGGVSRAYDAFDGRFRLTFQPVTARFVKVVNLTVDDALQEVFVSEIEMFGQELRRGSTRSATDTQSATATLTWLPREGLSATLNGFASRIDTALAATPEARVEDTAGNLAIGYQPSPFFVSTFTSLVSRRSRSLVDTEIEVSHGVTVTALPVEDLELTLTASRRDQERGPREAVTDAYLFRVATLLYRDLSFSAEYGNAAEETLDGPARARETFRVSLDTRPREEIELSSFLQTESLRTPSLAPPLRSQRTVNWDSRLTVRPSTMLSFSLQGIYFRFPGRDGWSRVVQVDWLPFAGGALQLSVDYREDVPLGGQERTVRAARLHWAMNRKMSLDFDATRQITRSPGEATARTLLTVFFRARL